MPVLAAAAGGLTEAICNTHTGLLVPTPVNGDDGAALVRHVKGLCRSPIQLGGKGTIGRGLCRVEVL